MIRHPAHPPHYLFPSEFDTHDPNFQRQFSSWATQTQRAIAGLIAGSKKTMADSHALMAKIDQILGLR